MLPAPFDYQRPTSLAEAISLLAQNEDAKVLAGGHSLIPAMKLRLAQPRTLGGSLVHADPAADWPAAVLALDAEFDVAGPKGRRTVRIADFFVEMMQSAVQQNEILCEIRLPLTPKSMAYVKFAQKASGFAIAGVAALVDKRNNTVAIGITGIAPKAYRARAVEHALRGKELTREAIREAAAKVIEEVEPLNDIHASAEFRAHLAQVNCRRALELALSRG